MRAFLFNQKMSFLLCFLFLVSSFPNTFVSTAQHLCHPDQRDLLVEFKTEFRVQKPVWVYSSWYQHSSEVSSYPKTETWVNNSDCCSWEGVTCDAKSGKVIELDLSGSCLHGRLESNSSLFRMHHLRYVNLGYNNFTDSPIPAEFDRLKGLERLNLSMSWFSGQIPNKLLQLTKLVSLDLSFSSSHFKYPQNSLSVDESFLRLVAQNLRNLRDLDMSFVNISSEIPLEFSNMSSLRSLRLEKCNLLGRFPSNVLLIPNLQSITLDRNPNLRGNLSIFRKNNSLLELSLSFTSFSGTIPDSINNLKRLTSLKLSYSNFSGRIPSSLGNLSNLSYLGLSFNKFLGQIPSSVANLKQLTVFSVKGNKLSGNFPSAILNLTQLRSINLGSNQFTGFLPPSISQLSKLESFYAYGNSFTGAIPSSLFNVSSLTTISLVRNNLNDLTGIENISLLPNLRSFFIGKNNYSVNPLDLNVFSPLKQLQDLDLSTIQLTTTNVTSHSEFLLNLEDLDLSSCNITEFPHFLRNQQKLSTLDLSNNKIKGQVPNWLWRLPKLSYVNLSNNSLSDFNGSLKASSAGSQISYLDLSSNAFQGPLFIPSTSILEYSASKNNFTGEIPQSICRLSSLSLLDLSNNNLHGSIPRCLETRMGALSDLNLGNNSFSGSLPEIFINATRLTSLDVSHNRLEGKLPASLTGCSALEVLNVESNRINDTFPFQLNSLQNLQVLVLRSNKFHGTLHKTGGVWDGFPELKIIDASHNDFLGNFPSDYFLNWTAISVKKDDYIGPEYIYDKFGWYYDSLVLMSKGISMEMERISYMETAIDFSGNQLHGPIPQSIGLLKELRMLNFSRNAFTGHIPSSLANLTNLESLDLSQNKLSGQIPFELARMNSLGWINVSHNEFVGSIPQGTQFQTQNCSSYEGNPGLYGSQISYLDLSANAFQGPVFIPSRSIQYYYASKNNFTGEIPRSICRLSSLSLLDLSNNNLHGSIPRCLETQMTSLSDLNLHKNRLNGSLPNIFTKARNLRSLDVGHNQLEGKIPKSLIGCSNLEVLNVGNNQINDTFPFWLSSLQNLQVLVLRFNEFHGVLHHPQVSFGFPHLRIIDLSNNGFTGSLGSDYFMNLKAMYTNGDDTELKYMGGDGSYYDSLVVISKGVEMEMTRILTIYTAIDFSGNNIQGNIPESIGLLKGLHVLNFSSNGFTGNIPSSLENLKKLESLDLSQNKLSGQIPPELAKLYSLEWINVSHNELVGPIPQGTQFQTQKCSSYEPNSRLYGSVLKDVCEDIHASTLQQPELLESEEVEDEEWFSWIAAGLGLVPGVVFGLTMGYIVASYKHEWFSKNFGRNKHRSTRTR